MKEDYNPVTITYIVTLERDVTDLEMCLLALRNIANNYPRHFDIAVRALQDEYNLPTDTSIQEISREQP